MKRHTSLVASCLMLTAAAHAAPPGKLTVKVNEPGIAISPSLYGIFFEEINLAGDGGLYAELVRNRSFEDSNKPDHWSLLGSGKARLDYEIDASQPQGEYNRNALKLTIANAGTRAGIANDGYFGIAIEKGEKYSLSFYARGDNNVPLFVSLENAAGVVYAQAKTANLSGGWKRFGFTLTANATDPKARLVISAKQPGTIYLDMVSLFPQDTFKNRNNGMRRDLAHKMAALKPAFMRFPGGCWVEGDTLATATRWKRTIGDPATRWTQPNIWGYNSTNGLGYHEYLQLSEDLGASSLFVVNCGMSHKQNVPMDQIGEWVQDALDAIEYATGPVTSKWGALRAKNGHPAPFDLEYIQIGNENGGPAYNERYAVFYDAIKAKYPNIKIVANEWQGRPTSRPIEILDEHYYNTPEFFARNAHKYDAYPRDRYKVYVGEYAVTQNGGAGNLKAALGEAAFMTGMERNSDVVVMSSYAPLFANVNYKRWNPDLINFDSARAYGTPSYYVQKLFAENRGDVVLPVQVEAQEVDMAPQGLRGGIGVGTWRTQAEFKDIKVTQGDNVLWQANLSGDTRGWKLQNGTWRMQDGALRQSSDAENVLATIGDAKWENYTLNLKARKISGAEGFLILGGVQPNGDYLWWNIGGWQNTRSAFERNSGGGKYEIGQSTNDKIETGRWYDIRLDVMGDTVRGYIDGRLVSEAKDSARPALPLHATASRDNKTGETILKVVNFYGTPQQLHVNLAGAKTVDKIVSAQVMTGKPEDENTLDAPQRVAPQKVMLTGAAPVFAHTFPAHSVTVLRLKAK